MKFEEIKSRIIAYKNEGNSLFTTSSFQSHSLVLLHILSRIDKTIPIVFINTGFHFPETIKFRDEVADLFGLTNLIDLKSDMPKSLQKGENGRLLFASDPDYCCHINKTEPLHNLLRTYDVWVNGVRADQSKVRSGMILEQDAPFGAVRFHAMLDWNSKMIHDYRKEYNLPTHPLDDQGYVSIGCEPCTRKIDINMSDRDVRWFGLNKTECGLHTDLIK
ncbi:MAG: phosphoadenylyl-sulfate reductase [Bacteroidetes bacterium]|nr:MAG: phosphoadenylyl-sulfate reductase [Bacteroidota bacterium]